MHSPSVFGLVSHFPVPPSERDSQTVVFFVSVLLVNLLLQCVFTSFSRTETADHLRYVLGTEMGDPTTWKVLC